MIELEFGKAWWVNTTVYETTGAMLLDSIIPLEDFHWEGYDWQIVERKDHFMILKGAYSLGSYIYIAIKVITESECTDQDSRPASLTIDEAADAVKWLVDTHSTIMLNDGVKCILYTPSLGTVEAQSIETAVAVQRDKIAQQRQGGS